MTLSNKLQAFRQYELSQLSDDVLDVLCRNISLMQEQHLADKALKVGDQFPYFNLPESDGGNCSSNDLLAQGPLIVSFYRGGWCPYCILELKALREIIGELTDINANLVAVTPEHISQTAETKSTNALNFRVLSDSDNRLARRCGLVFSLSEEMQALYDKFGIDIKAHNQNEKNELPIPASYVVDEHNLIRYAFVEENYTTRADPETIMQVLQSL